MVIGWRLPIRQPVAFGMGQPFTNRFAVGPDVGMNGRWCSYIGHLTRGFQHRVGSTRISPLFGSNAAIADLEVSNLPAL